jgi:23S rRNA (adenine2030-N6)-methyltransferase
MLSYQHIYHAGCLADVHKHAALCALLNIMVQKEKPLTYIETHAGRGFYDMRAPEAQKTGEYLSGIMRVKSEKWFDKNHPYESALATIEQSKESNIYPGSALFARTILRTEDKMHLMELHPQEFHHLRTNMHGTGANIYQKDGYENLLSLSPPTPRRGIVFIDPSYEIKSEYQTVPSIVEKLLKRWPVAVICIWYPHLAAGLYKEMLKNLHELNIEKSGNFDIDFSKEKKGMRGSGLFLANMPFGAEDAINNVQNAISKYY